MSNIELLEQLESSFKKQIKDLEERQEELRNCDFERLQDDIQSRIIQAYQMLIEVQTLKLKY